MNIIETLRQAGTNGEAALHAGSRPAAQAGFSVRSVFAILAAAACYYLATRIAWTLTFPDSKVSLFFPPHAVLVSILLLVPTRQWWAYTLAAASAHFFATQQAGWPPVYALQCEAFDAVKYLLTAGGIRFFISTPFDRLTLRDAIVFVLVAVVIVPFATAFWGAAFTLAYGFGSSYWVEWRNLGVSNGVTAIVLVPAIVLGAHTFVSKRFSTDPGRILEGALLAVALFAVGYFAFDRYSAGPTTSPALLYAPVPLLIWAALRFGLGGMSASMLVVTMMAIWGTMQGHGPFLAQSAPENALDLQLFLVMVATPLLLLAVAIGEERHSKEALRVSEERMGLALEGAALALWEWDCESDSVWMTEDGRGIFGFGADEALKFSNLGDRVHPDDRALREATIKQALESGGSYEVEYRILQPDGEVRWIAGRGRCHKPAASGESPRLLGVSMDVTQQKRANAEAQEQREELAHLSRAATLSTISGSLAHELSQPLSSILSNAQAGLRFLSKNPPDVAELRTILGIVVAEERRAGEIIGRLRTMLRRGQVSLQPVNVNEALDELLRLLRSDLSARGVSVFNLAEAALPPAMTDRVQLQQVLLNLIVNACDAMEPVAPRDRLLTLTASVVDGEMRIGVLDCGVGFPDDVETLFKPFYTTKESGLGMGLSICRTLIDSHRGRLWAEHRLERGAAFYVALPLARGSA